MCNIKFVRTMLKDIDPKELGITDCHDHLIKKGGPEVAEHIDFLMLSVPAAIKEVSEYLEKGGKTIVTMDPPNVGRDVEKMAEIALHFENQAHFLMATGFHKAKFYDRWTSWLATNSVKEITEMVVKEITEGMDYYNYNGPIVKRSPYKAGIIKAGTGYGTIDWMELKALEVAARASVITGAPILVHTQLGTMAYEAAQHLIDFGANPRKIQLSHLNKNPNKYYYQKIIQELGVSICFDGPDRVKYYPDSTLAENLAWLIKNGYQKNITLSLDAGRILYQKHYGLEKRQETYGFAYLFDRFIPLLKQLGIQEDALEDLLVNNPREILTFDEPKDYQQIKIHPRVSALKKALKVT